MPSLHAFELVTSQIPATYTPALLTVTGTLLAAAFTSVIAQYFFAPTLEARKQRLLDRSVAAATTVDKLREMQLRLEMAQMAHSMDEKRLMLKHKAQFDALALEFDALLSLAHSGLSSKYTALALQTQMTGEIFTMLDDPAEGQLKDVLRLLTHSIRALDPANLPWTRAFHRVKGQKLRVLLAPPAGVDVNA